MTGYQTYSLILCLIVFAMLVLLSVVVIAIITRQRVHLIGYGAEDEDILAEHEKELNKKQSKLGKALDCGITLLLGLVFVFAFVSSIFINQSGKEGQAQGATPIFRVVKTDSMAKKNAKNTYLNYFKLDDQFQAMDVIVTHQLPAEMDLQIYDIVVYETKEGLLLVHRIVGIEEPNLKHPNERHFVLQGDAVDSPDRFPVLYSQMRGIYKGERVPFVGSFVLFLQSPAGWACLLLVVVAIVVAPILEKYLKEKRDLRLQLLLAEQTKEEEAVSTPSTSSMPDSGEKVVKLYKVGTPAKSQVVVKDGKAYMYLAVDSSLATKGGEAADGKAKKYLLQVAGTKKEEEDASNVGSVEGGSV